MRLKRTGISIRRFLKFTTVFLILACGPLVEAQMLQTLCSFNYANGMWPVAVLTLANDGNFYGTTRYGGSSGSGTVFKVTTNGTLTTVASFSGTNGADPFAGLTLGNDGNFYGTTWAGGITNSSYTSGMGTVFQVTTNGVLTALVSFSDTNGMWPFAALTLGNDGNFYGTTQNGGSSGYGTVFKMATNGTLTTLVSFSLTNGAQPHAGLTLGNDGNFYGTTSYGGITNSSYPHGSGTVFQVTTNGMLTTLASFSGTNGAAPFAGLTLGNDGNFYGTTFFGGITNSTYDSYGLGTVFQVTTNGALTTLVCFDFTNGAKPVAGLTLGGDGSFYGTTRFGGITNSSYTSGMGTVFQVTTNGVLTTLVSFSGTNGAEPFAALTLGNDGNFYGTTGEGGSSWYGTVFRLSLQPIITVQPQSQTNYAGATVTFHASATGPYPLVYQWQKNGTNLVDAGSISGAATNTLTITSISDRDAASYSVTVSHANSSATSSNAVLTVNNSLFIAAQPQSQTVGLGSIVTFTVTAYGASPKVFQWYFNGTPFGAPTSGTNSSSCTLTNVGSQQAGNYSVRVVNGYGSVTSSNAVLTVKAFPPGISLQPSSQTAIVGNSVSFSVSVTGTPPFHYQWQFNGTNLPNATKAVYELQAVGAPNAGNYCVIVTNSAGSVTSSNALLSVIVPPLITVQPTNLLILPGANGEFGVSVTGTPPFYYQWQFNGNDLQDATNAAYSIPSVGTNNAGYYSVVVTNLAGSVTSSNAALTVFLSPQSRTNQAGSTATFTVTSLGPEALSYQWQRNGTNLVEGGRFAGTDSNVLTIANVSDEDATSYSAVVSDAYSSVTTANALLTVIHPPLITAQPTSLVLLSGTNATFSVSVSDTAPFTYQWQFNGSNLQDATNALYSIQRVDTNNAGAYAVIITNATGSATSSNAALTVVLSPQNRTNVAGETATFTATTFGPVDLNYQWRKNGTNLVEGGRLSGATNSTLTISGVSDADAAMYSAVVSDDYGSVITFDALLRVIARPTLTLELWAGYPLLNLYGMLSNDFVVQYNTNLTDPNWIHLLSLTNLPYSPYLFLDPAGDGEPARFYRAFMQ